MSKLSKKPSIRELAFLPFTIIFVGIAIYFAWTVLQEPVLYLISSLVFSFGFLLLIWRYSTLIVRVRRKGLLLFTLVLLFMMAGLVAGELAGGTHRYLESAGMSESDVSIKMAPFTEEAFKIFGVLVVAHGFMERKSKNILWILIMGGIIVGLTFGFAETLGNPEYRGHFSERLFTSIPQHGLLTAMIAASLYLPLKEYPDKRASPLLFLAVYFIASIWHSWWNSSLLPEPLKWIAFPVVVVLVFLSILKLRRLKQR
jgi:hypothetical protein